MKNETIQGQLRLGPKKTASINTQDGQLIAIDFNKINTALHGDLVTIQNKEVIEINKRLKTKFVGTVIKKDGQLLIKPDDKKMYTLLKPNSDKIKIKEKILVNLKKWDKKDKYPEVEILKILGKQGEHETEIQSIIAAREIDTLFKKELEQEAQSIANNWQIDLEKEIDKRKDFRNTTTLTIDPIDAKDFDDALSIKKINNDLYEIGIHITDVSHYVRPKSKIDTEAAKRATSIYLVDRTIPMLPEILSNEICSLKPNEDRLAFSAVFEMNLEGEIIKEWFGRTVIHSDKRFTYEEVQEILDKQSGQYSEELKILNSIAKKLKKQNEQAGSLSFEEPEVKFKLDQQGKILEIYKKERTDSNLLVENFMLLANKQVAKFAHNFNEGKDHTFIYRVHDTPSIEKINSLAVFLKPLGYEIKLTDDKILSKDLNLILEQAEKAAESHIVNRATVRAMAKAIYSTKNIGHWGLAFDFYTHFTSPIRRYPDLMVHRLIDLYLKGKKADPKTLTEISKQVIHSSEMEQRAAEAERESIKFKQVEYMSEKIGSEFNGIISGVTEWGIYVEEEETRSEGMVKLNSLDDYYTFDEKSLSLIGKTTKNRFRLGDKIKIKLVDADIEKRTLDFELVN